MIVMVIIFKLYSPTNPEKDQLLFHPFVRVSKREGTTRSGSRATVSKMGTYPYVPSIHLYITPATVRPNPAPWRSCRRPCLCLG